VRRRLLPAALLAVGALAAPAVALPAGQPLPTPGFASKNVEWLGNIPLNADSSGAHLLGKHLYVTSSSQLSIYDVSTPESPRLLSTIPSPQQAAFAEEDVDTNGSILLISALSEIRVYDIKDKAAPRQIGSLRGGGDPHTLSCVLQCRYAWGSEGQVYDLTDPTAPKRVAGLDWNKAQEGFERPGQTHDVTEVAPGMVLTSTRFPTLFDLTDPLAPRIVAQGTSGDNRFIHANLWPRQMKDRWLLIGGETSASDCSDPRGGAFMTWDTTDWEKTRRFSLVDSYRPAANGVQNGEGLVETFCSHWFTPRPGWEDGGQLAVSWYEHGTRFLEVDEEGSIEEIGFFTPVGTQASAAYWVTDQIVYVLDYTRGLDVLRFTGDKPARDSAPLRTGLFAGGLAPDAVPARRPRLTPAMLDGENWRC
jgi:hypothetical protein